MGGHGGLNILPQKRWNVYRFDNREKVRKDEEEAAKEEQLKREQSRKRDTEFRIQQLRQSRGSAPASASTVAAESTPSPSPSLEAEAKPKSKHINLFEGIRIFDPVEIKSDDNNKNNKRELLGDEKRKGFKRMKKEAEAPKVVLPEDEKYRLGYGVAGKGVKLPWYMEKQPPKSPSNEKEIDSEKITKSSNSNIRKKSVEELREERLKRERKEKERERALLLQHKGNDRRGYSYATRR